MPIPNRRKPQPRVTVRDATPFEVAALELARAVNRTGDYDDDDKDGYASELRHYAYRMTREFQLSQVNGPCVRVEFTGSSYE